MRLRFSRNLQAPTRILLAMVVAVVLAVFGVAGTAHAAPMGTTPTTKHATPTTKHGQIQPFTSGGGCYGTDYVNPPEHDGACVSENSSGYIVPDGYVYAQSGVSSGWTYCQATVYLWDYTNSWSRSSGQTWDCLYDFQHLIVDHIYGYQALAYGGHTYKTEVDLTTTHLGSITTEVQYSPQLFT